MSQPVKTNRQRVPDSVWSSSLLSAVLAVVLVLEIVGLGVYGYYRAQRLLDPENLADRAEEAIRENYPEVRANLVEQIQSQAPEIAEQVSAEMIASTPEARQQLEEFTARQIQLGLDEATELSAEQFRNLLQRNREEIIAAFEKIEAAPQETEELVLQTEASLEQELGVDLQKQARQALRTHRQLNDKLQRLVESEEELLAQELLERRIVRILKTMQAQPAPRLTSRKR